MPFDEVIRRGWEAGVLDAEIGQWREFRKNRGTTSHTYDEEKAQAVFETIPAFLAQARFLAEAVSTIPIKPMSGPIAIAERDLAMVRDILGRELPPTAQVWVFGSRARGTEKRGADLDLAIDARRPLTPSESHALAMAFEDSDLPYTVDVVDLANVGETFRAIIERDRILLATLARSDTM